MRHYASRGASGLAVESRDLIGGRYAQVRPVGTGKMSTVWLAEDDRRQHQRIALKLLDTEHPDAVRHEIFRRETQSLERLDHPNIVRIWDHGWDEPRHCYYIALEFLGRTLLDEIAHHPDPRDNDWCWPVMRNMADALQHAHNEDVIHRDLKPSNILFADDGTPKLTDFGISRLKYELSIGLTVAGFWSPGYAAPEQRMRGEADERSDIYSLGAVFYHLLSRRAPGGDGPMPTDIEALVHVPKPIRNLLGSMLDPDPGKRPGDSAQVRRRLDQTEALTAPVIYLVVSDRARRDMVDLGFIQLASNQAAQVSCPGSGGGSWTWNHAA